MTKTFTPNELIRYYYQEISEEERKKVEKALIVDAELQEQYKELSKVIKKLDNLYREPSDKTIKSILDYSKTFNLHRNDSISDAKEKKV